MLMKLLREFKNDERGSVLVELAFAIPIFTGVGFTFIEAANYVNTHTKVSQMTISLADNLSRAKQDVPIGLPQFREHDISDALEGVRLQAGGLDLFGKGRVIISSLQVFPGSNPARQWIAWQRCKGALVVNSNYGLEDKGRTGAMFAGVQEAGNTTVTVPAGEAIIFVEVTYTYEPIIAASIIGEQTIKQVASFYVRDDRNLGDATNINGIFNPTPVSPVRRCNVYTAT